MKIPMFRRNGRGSVLLICCLLIGSAAIRVGSEAGKAVATESPFPVPANSEVAKTPASSEENKEDFARMLLAFKQREERIERLEHQIDMRQKALEVADAEIEKRLQVLQDAENALRSMLAIADTAAEDDVVRLTSVYENMKPKVAAALFEEMEPAFAAGFLGRMRPDAAAGIMSGLTPNKAYTISVILAGRNAEAPKG